jgi:hypothetical protein
MEYIILIGHSGQDLTKQVSEKIKEGWKPIGSHHVAIRHEQNRFRGNQHVDTINDLEYSQTMEKIDEAKKLFWDDVIDSEYYNKKNIAKKVWDDIHKSRENITKDEFVKEVTDGINQTLSSIISYPLLAIAKKVWDDIHNNDTLIYNDFESYWNKYEAI